MQSRSLDQGLPQDPLTGLTLLLNRSYVPVRLATVRRALGLLYAGIARALDSQGELLDFEAWITLPAHGHPDALGTSRGKVRVPRVLHLEHYDRIPQRQVRLTRRNLLLRDDYECQYCGARPGAKALSVDHVLPRSRGGRDSWVNLVISCRRCNLRKRDRTPHEANMGLLRPPKPPPWSRIEQLRLSTRLFFPEWAPFLGSAEISAASEYRRSA